jgi:transaldolase
MKLFLDTADVAQIQYWKEVGILDGVTTNPTHLSKEKKSPQEIIKTICALLPQGDISVEVTQQDPQQVYEQAKAIAALGKNVTVKIPCQLQYYPIIKKLVAEGIRVNVTLLFTLVQGFMMCKLGVSYISPFVGRWDDNDINGIELLDSLRDMIDSYGYETKILAASLRTVRHFHDALAAGADVATVSPELLAKSVHHILTEQGIQAFTADWAKLGITQFP